MPSTPFGSKVILHFTLISMLSEIFPEVTVIVTVPGLIAVTTPFSSTTVTFSLLLFHVILSVEFCGLTSAISSILSPTHIFSLLFKIDILSVVTIFPIFIALLLYILYISVISASIASSMLSVFSLYNIFHSFVGSIDGTLTKTPFDLDFVVASMFPPFISTLL